MLIVRTSLFSGKKTERELDITPEQYKQFQDGELVQFAFPNLDANDREFILTGALPGEFDAAMAGMEDDGEGTPDPYDDVPL